jgi:hypothetical protein
VHFSFCSASFGHINFTVFSDSSVKEPPELT